MATADPDWRSPVPISSEPRNNVNVSEAWSHSGNALVEY